MPNLWDPKLNERGKDIDCDHGNELSPEGCQDYQEHNPTRVFYCPIQPVNHFSYLAATEIRSMQHVHITNSVPFINEKGCREIGGQLTWQVLRSFLPVIFKNKLDQQAKRQPLTGEKKAELTTRGCGISKRGCPSLMPRRSHNFRQ